MTNRHAELIIMKKIVDATPSKRIKKAILADIRRIANENQIYQGIKIKGGIQFDSPEWSLLMNSYFNNLRMGITMQSLWKPSSKSKTNYNSKTKGKKDEINKREGA